jgi:hypothetical protein
MHDMGCHLLPGSSQTCIHEEALNARIVDLVATFGHDALSLARQAKQLGTYHYGLSILIFNVLPVDVLQNYITREADV